MALEVGLDVAEVSSGRAPRPRRRTSGRRRSRRRGTSDRRLGRRLVRGARGLVTPWRGDGYRCRGRPDTAHPCRADSCLQDRCSPGSKTGRSDRPVGEVLAAPAIRLRVRGSVSSGADGAVETRPGVAAGRATTAAFRIIPPELSRRNSANVRSVSVSPRRPPGPRHSWPSVSRRTASTHETNPPVGSRPRAVQGRARCPIAGTRPMPRSRRNPVAGRGFASWCFSQSAPGCPGGESPPILTT